MCYTNACSCLLGSSWVWLRGALAREQRERECELGVLIPLRGAAPQVKWPAPYCQSEHFLPSPRAAMLCCYVSGSACAMWYTAYCPIPCDFPHPSETFVKSPFSRLSSIYFIWVWHLCPSGSWVCLRCYSFCIAFSFQTRFMSYFWKFFLNYILKYFSTSLQQPLWLLTLH